MHKEVPKEKTQSGKQKIICAANSWWLTIKWDGFHSSNKDSNGTIPQWIETAKENDACISEA